MTDAEVIEALALDTAELAEIAEWCPLALWRAWHREGVEDFLGTPRKRTSQRAVLRDLGPQYTVVVGGNRSGKTEIGRALLVAHALGSDHPAVVCFCAVNDVDPATIPRGPATVWAYAITASDSIRYHRHDVKRLLPRDGSTHWWALEGKDEARVRIDCPGYTEQAEIVFKSVGIHVEEARQKAQGAKIRLGWHDELQPEEVVDEVGVRTWDLQGRQIFTLTPVKGIGWMRRRFLLATDWTSTRVHHLHTEDNPYLPREVIDRELRGDRRRALIRLHGEDVPAEGLVFPAFARSTHVARPYEIPRAWPRFRAIDFGTRNPFCCLWGALAPSGQLVIYREHYRAEWTLRQHSDAIHQIEGRKRDGVRWVPTETSERIEQTWADPEDAQSMLALRREYDVYAVPADKAIHAGIDAVAERLAPDVEGRPGLVIFDCCPRTIEEFGAYVWATRTYESRDAPDLPRKIGDHAMDALRYLCHGVRRYG